MPGCGMVSAGGVDPDRPKVNQARGSHPVAFVVGMIGLLTFRPWSEGASRHLGGLEFWWAPGSQVWGCLPVEQTGQQSTSMLTSVRLTNQKRPATPAPLARSRFDSSLNPVHARSLSAKASSMSRCPHAKFRPTMSRRAQFVRGQPFQHAGSHCPFEAQFLVTGLRPILLIMSFRLPILLSGGLRRYDNSIACKRE